MATFSNKKIEAFAVTAVTTAANHFPLTPEIPIGDKGISFDGHIDVMSDDSEKKESFLGKVPVQVKGNQVKQFSGRTRNFSLELSHYKNFYKTNGAVLFVVEIDSTGDTKIFYKHLLPYELKLIITQYKNQKTRTIELRVLDETTIYDVCKRFLKEVKRQPTSLIENNPFNQDDFTTFAISSLTFKPEIDRNIEEHDFTFYGVVDNLLVPMGIGKLIEESKEGLEILQIDDKEFEVMVEMKKNKQNNIITIILENSLELVIDKNNFSYAIKKYVSVDTQLKILPILISFLSEKKIRFVKNKYDFSEGQAKDPNVVTKFKELLNDFKMLKKAFSILKVDPKTKFINESNGLLTQIRYFNDLIVNKDLTNLNKEFLNQYLLFTFDLGGLKFLLLKESQPTIHFISAFSEEILKKFPTLKFKDKDQKATNNYPSSPYIKMDYYELSQLVNIDFETLKKSFDIMNPIMENETFDLVNYFCLNCINAYDEIHRSEFLEIADYIYSLYKGGLEENENVIRINHLQIKFRLNNGNLSSEDINELIKLKQNTTNEELLFCASVMLGSTLEAKAYLNGFSEAYKEAYKKYPIYHLFKALK